MFPHKRDPLLYGSQSRGSSCGDVKAMHGTFGFVQRYFNARVSEACSIENAIIVETVKLCRFDVGGGGGAP